MDIRTLYIVLSSISLSFLIVTSVVQRQLRSYAGSRFWIAGSAAITIGDLQDRIVVVNLEFGFLWIPIAGTVIRNILSNAIKFTPTQRVIKIDIIEESNNTTISIFNSGNGFAEKTLKSIHDQIIHFAENFSPSINEKFYKSIILSQ